MLKLDCSFSFFYSIWTHTLSPINSRLGTKNFIFTTSFSPFFQFFTRKKNSLKQVHIERMRKTQQNFIASHDSAKVERHFAEFFLLFSQSLPSLSIYINSCFFLFCFVSAERTKITKRNQMSKMSYLLSLCFFFFSSITISY